MHAINSDGSLRWKYTTGGLVGTRSAIGFDGTVYVGAFDSVFMQLINMETKNGYTKQEDLLVVQQLWGTMEQYTLGLPTRRCMPSIAMALKSGCLKQAI